MSLYILDSHLAAKQHKHVICASNFAFQLLSDYSIIQLLSKKGVF